MYEYIPAYLIPEFGYDLCDTVVHAAIIALMSGDGVADDESEAAADEQRERRAEGGRAGGVPVGVRRGTERQATAAAAPVVYAIAAAGLAGLHESSAERLRALLVDVVVHVVLGEAGRAELAPEAVAARVERVAVELVRDGVSICNGDGEAECSFVVHSAQLRAAQRAVSLGHRLELLYGRRIVFAFIRMMFLGKSEVCGFDLFGRGVAVELEIVVQRPSPARRRVPLGARRRRRPIEMREKQATQTMNYPWFRIPLIKAG